jgi:hypothetical protein
MKPININDQCPCRSGNTIKECHCLQPNLTLIPPDLSTLPKLPKTGYVNPKCYAGFFQDCSKQISGEHYVSRSILEEIQNENGKGVLTSGMRWMEPNSVQQYSVSNLRAKVLCERHNSVLSGLDMVGLIFFRQLRDFQHTFNNVNRDKSREFCLFNGHDIERWMLKLLCGVIASKNHSKQRKDLDTSIPEAWLRILYGFEYFRERLGMYYVGQFPTSGVGYNICWNTTEDQIIGIYIVINNMGFFLAVANPDEHNVKLVHPKMDYRLGGFSFIAELTQKERDKDRKTILIGWRLQHTDKLSNIVIRPTKN